MLRPQPISPVPDATARVAHAAFRKGNVYMRMYDELGAMFTDEAFTPLFPPGGRPVEVPWRLALVTIMQYAEGLSDRQAADAVRARIDWKYTLALELDDPGFDASVLSEFRTRLVANREEHLVLDLMLERFRERKLLAAGGRQRTDSTHVLGAIRALNRLECVGETMRHALNSLAVVAPAWLRATAQSDWVRRYERRVDDHHLPKGQAQRQAMGETIGVDGLHLLTTVYAPDAPTWLREVPAVQTLRRVWIQHFYVEEGIVHWRTDERGIPPSSLMISSPYDLDAHYAKKDTTSWIGYKVHVTETCDDDSPRLITQIATSGGPTADGAMTPTIHATLERKNLLPRLHIVDTGYLDAQLLVDSRRDYDVELLGPTRKDYRWRARAAVGFGAADFTVDWAHRRATCPQGHTSIEWSERTDVRGNDRVYIRFSKAACGPCPCRPLCTTSQARDPRRSLSIRPRKQYEALRQRRAYEESDT